MPGTKPLCAVYSNLYQKCIEGKKMDHMKTCDDYIFMLKATGCAYHYYEVFKLDKRLKVAPDEIHSER